MLLKNRVTELEIRDFLNQEGFLGNAARLQDVELVAIKPPGWLQVYRFEVEVRREDGPWEHYWGAVQDDQRMGRDIELFAEEKSRNERLNEWTVEMKTRVRNRENDPLLVMVAAGLFIVVSGVVLMNMLKGAPENKAQASQLESSMIQSVE